MIHLKPVHRYEALSNYHLKEKFESPRSNTVCDMLNEVSCIAALNGIITRPNRRDIRRTFVAWTAKVIAVIAGLTSVVNGANAQNSSPLGDPLGPDLYRAIATNNISRIQQIIDSGAKLEGVNWLGITALHWAGSSAKEAAVDVLLRNRANVNADSIYGSVLEGAIMGGNPKIVDKLVAAGATFSKNRGDMITAPMMAAQVGDPQIMRSILSKKPDVNVVSLSGMTALMHAARRGYTECAQLLLDAGANTEIMDNLGRNALMYAALNGHPDIVSTLLATKPVVDRKDKAGDDALILAARYSGDPTIATALLNAGANRTATDAKGISVVQIAQKRGFNAFAATVSGKKTSAVSASSIPDVSPSESGITRFTPTLAGTQRSDPLIQKARQAVWRSLPLLQKTTVTFSEKSPCTSCHHQGIGFLTTSTAKRLGYAIDEKAAASQQKVITGGAEAGIKDLQALVAHPENYKYFPTADIDEFSFDIGTLYTALNEYESPRTPATDVLVTMLAHEQHPDGSWRYGFIRAPIQSSFFTVTAYAVRALKHYMPDSRAKERDERIARALKWLRETPSKTGEDRASQLLGLKWAGASRTDINRAITQNRSAQRRDGGWSQFDPGSSEAKREGAMYARSDPYATGHTLFALSEAGGIDPLKDITYRRGIEYLLRMQDEDGSWFVNKRAMPLNNFIDTGFPHGESQYISYGATCYATLSLMYAAGQYPHSTRNASSK